MITKDNFKQVLNKLGFSEDKDFFTKKFSDFDMELKVDFDKGELIYPENKGLKINERQTCNFKASENFVVFECVNRLLEQGYNPAHIELEPKWQLGHGANGGRADILVKDNNGNSLLIIECKTAGGEFNKAWNETKNKPTQLFSYAQQVRSTKFLSLYTSDFIDEKVKSDYYLISLQDNDDFLKTNNEFLSFKDANTVGEIFKVWSETYGQDYRTLGLFEDNKPYEIGKTKFVLKDLKTVTSKDIQGKYHEFATILRQHNVSGRENAFDKLVNLFLCKVVDETNNENELKFYWKGKAYDNAFDFQDRLQKLYSIGMKSFLGEEITYIENNQIDEAFRFFKNKPNATKDVIKEYFKQLKFFTNSDFAFIDVHNEKLFNQNFKVLLEIMQIFQDIKLTGGEENQFLGDMFEGFLDQGVKQSEGQYFTPMPIVKFLIKSLPKLENPKVIDYACGAGHFLNEYALQNKESEVIGIEKEYRLSKVAKVSAFMYGNDEMKIIYADALVENKEIKNNSFDVLVANPPYSVKGFLGTLNEEDRVKFELINNIDKKSYSSNNSIECFFIERAKQLLKDGGVCAIIVPSSVLNKGGIYSQTREIILKYFDIIALYESGSGTFGKTGTNTITLFLRKRKSSPVFADHYKNMVNIWFEGDLETNENNFENTEILQKYCEHCNFDFSEYKEFLKIPLIPFIKGVNEEGIGRLESELFQTEVFREYKQSFDKLATTKKSKDLIKDFIKYSREIEKEKVYYFGLAYTNSTNVIIVKSPSGNSEIKNFLGYEWGTRRGNEGIKYITSGNVKIENEEELDEEDKRVLENISSLNNIETPLYNPKDEYDESKINTLIKKNFEYATVGNENFRSQPEIPDSLKEFVNTSRLIDMLDFSRNTFDKVLSLNPKNIKPIESNKYNQVNFKELFSEIKNGKNVNQFDEKGHFRVSRIESIASGYFDINATKWTNDNINSNDFLEKGDILFSHINSVKHLGKTAFFDLDDKIVHGINLLKFRANSDKIFPRYAIELFKLNSFKNEIENQAQKAVNQASVNISYLNELYFPLPPLNIQKQIVEECEKVDAEVKNAKNVIDESKKEIKKVIGNIEGEMVKLGDISLIQSGGTPRREKNEYWNGNIPWLRSEVCKDNYVYENQVNEKITQLGLEKSSARIFKKDTILVAMVGATIGKVGYLTFESTTNQNIAGIYPIDFNKISSQYLYNQIKNLYGEFMKIGEGKFAMANLSFIKNLKIPLPPLEIQKEIVSKIEEIDKKIEENKKILESGKCRKEEILRNYL